MKQNSPDQELVLYSHSMGGLIAALYLETYPQVFSLGILSSPMLEIETGTFPSPVVSLVTFLKNSFHQQFDYVPGHQPFNGILKFKESSCDSLARYQYLFQKRLDEIKYQTYGATYGWLAASQRAVKQVFCEKDQLAVPVLLITAGKDTVVRNAGQYRFVRDSHLIRHIKFMDAKHEIYNSSTDIRRKYYNSIFSFIETFRQVPDDRSIQK